MLAPPADPPTAVLPAGAPGGPPGPPPTLVGMPASGEPPPRRPGPAGPPTDRPPRRPSRARRGALLAVVAVVLLGAVVGAVALTTRGGGALLTTAPRAGAPPGVPSAPAASGTLDPGTGATLVDAAAFGVDGPRFTTPTGNIACQMTDTSPTGDGEARCDVAERTWPVPPKPADCTGAYGGGASVSGAGKGMLTCAGDTVADPGLRVLAYGQAVAYGGIVCDSQETGVRCVNRATGHGFRVARASYDLF
jgi:hypothetical protein